MPSPKTSFLTIFDPFLDLLFDPFFGVFGVLGFLAIFGLFWGFWGFWGFSRYRYPGTAFSVAAVANLVMIMLS